MRGAWAIVLGACAAASAQPTPGPAAPPAPRATVPADWQPLPALVEALPGAGAPLIAAWGDPADGCYAAWYADATAGSLTREHGHLATSLAALGVTALPPLPAGATSWTGQSPIAGDGLRGTLTLRLDAAGGRVALAATACAGNDRAPARCAATCATLAGTAPP